MILVMVMNLVDLRDTGMRHIDKVGESTEYCCITSHNDLV